MPSPDRYLKGFGLARKMRIANYELEMVRIVHTPIERYKRYRYDTTMVWTPLKDALSGDAFVRLLDRRLSDNRLIRTRYGTPYYCSFGDIHYKVGDDGVVHIRAVGHCVRG